MTIIRVAQEVAGEIQKKIANNILVTDIQTLDNRHSGKYISNIMFDAHQIQSLVSTGVLNLMKDSFSIVALVALMFYQNWKLALFAIIMMPLAAIFAKSLGKRMGKATSAGAESAANFTTLLTEILKGSKIIKIYQREGIEEEKSKTAIKDMAEKQITIGRVHSKKLSSFSFLESTLR